MASGHFGNVASRCGKFVVVAVVGIALVAASAVAPNIAEAGFDRLDRDYSKGYVIAHSRFHNGSVRGRVREARMGYQVQLPSGHWEYCRRSCSETLRVETVDKWEGVIPGSPGLVDECGIFGCLDLHLRY